MGRRGCVCQTPWDLSSRWTWTSVGSHAETPLTLVRSLAASPGRNFGISAHSIHSGQDKLGNELPLWNEQRRVVVASPGEPDHQVQRGDPHEDLPAIAGREEP